jgi:hypothetical protein
LNRQDAKAPRKNAKEEAFRFVDFRALQAAGFTLALPLGVLEPWRFLFRV